MLVQPHKALHHQRMSSIEEECAACVLFAAPAPTCLPECAAFGQTGNAARQAGRLGGSPVVHGCCPSQLPQRALLWQGPWHVMTAGCHVSQGQSPCWAPCLSRSTAVQDTMFDQVNHRAGYHATLTRSTTMPGAMFDQVSHRAGGAIMHDQV